MESDLYDIICACINGQLHTVTPKFYDNKYAVAVVLVANGYPNKYKKGIEIKGMFYIKYSIPHYLCYYMVVGVHKLLTVL